MERLSTGLRTGARHGVCRRTCRASVGLSFHPRRRHRRQADATMVLKAAWKKLANCRDFILWLAVLDAWPMNGGRRSSFDD